MTKVWFLLCAIVISYLIIYFCTMLYNSILRRLYACSYWFSRIGGIISFVLVPIHEIFHMIGCIVFNHKIRSVKLWNKNSSAYVIHSWDRNDKYQTIGAIFVPLMPLFIPTSLYLLLVEFDASFFYYSRYALINVFFYEPYDIFMLLKNMTLEIFLECYYSGAYSVFTLILFSLFSAHTLPSTKDQNNFIKGMALNIFTILLLFLIFFGAIYFFNITIYAMIAICVLGLASWYMVITITLSFIFMIVYLITYIQLKLKVFNGD